MEKKTNIINLEEYEKLTLIEKWRFLCEKRDEIDRRVRRLIRR